MSAEVTPEEALEQLRAAVESFQKFDFGIGGNLRTVTCFSTLFAEWEEQETGLVVHLFPRGGAGDEWFEGHYLPRCQNCRRDVAVPRRLSELKPCPACGCSGLMYVPGRGEAPADGLVFPENIEQVIRSAGNRVFMGDVFIDFVPELEAWALKFIGVAADVFTAEGGPLDRFLGIVDQALEN